LKSIRKVCVIFMDYINAFWVGGLICALAQILLDRTKMMPGRVMVLLVCLGAIISFVGLYEPLLEYAGAGALVPLLGYGNVLMKGIKEAVDKDGFIGLFRGGFTSGAVGCSAALIFGYIASLVFKSKMTKA
jgi:stage V sporulation protein AE